MVLTTQLDDRLVAIELPSAVHSIHPFDRVVIDGKLIGLSTWIGYSANQSRLLRT